MSNLAGKVIIVTGASRGIGSAAALALGKAGATLMLTARDGRLAGDVAQAVVDAGGRATARSCDVSDYAATEAVVTETIGRYGRVDALINNAGVIEPIARIEDSDPAAWARNIEINLIGAYNAVRSALPAMIGQGGGTIVNVSSGAAIRPLARGCRRRAMRRAYNRALPRRPGPRPAHPDPLVQAMADPQTQPDDREPGALPARQPRDPEEASRALIEVQEMLRRHHVVFELAHRQRHGERDERHDDHPPGPMHRVGRVEDDEAPEQAGIGHAVEGRVEERAVRGRPAGAARHLPVDDVEEGEEPEGPPAGGDSPHREEHPDDRRHA